MRRFRYYCNGIFIYNIHEQEVYKKFQNVMSDDQIVELLNGQPQTDIDGYVFALDEIM